jgi:hypothetical protein
LGYSPSAAANVLADLALLSDHLPVIAEYAYTPTPEPMSMVLMVGVIGGTLLNRRIRAN